MASALAKLGRSDRMTERMRDGKTFIVYDRFDANLADRYAVKSRGR